MAASILPEIERLSPRVIRILGLNPGPFTLQGTNTYLLGTGSRRILVDTGEGRVGYAKLLKKVLDEQQCGVEKIVLTHWHHDHVGGLKDVLALAQGAKVEVVKWPNPVRKPPAPTKDLSDGDVVQVEGATVRVVHTPGHTDDHVALWLDEDHALLSGDAILGGGSSTVFTCLKKYLDSLNRILALAPARIFPGHGPLVEPGVPAVEQYIAHRMRREEQIITVLRHQADLADKEGTGWGGMTAAELVKIIYTETPANLHAAAAGSVILHLRKLELDGVVLAMRCVGEESGTTKPREAVDEEEEEARAVRERDLSTKWSPA